MDLSKLPKLSKTHEHRAAAPPTDTYPPPHASPAKLGYYADDEGPLGFIDIFLAIGMGLLFAFLGMNYGKHLMGSKDAYPEIQGTGFVWSTGHPLQGQPIPPEQLSPENRKAYDGRVLGRQMGIVSESSLFFMGCGLIFAGAIGVVGHLTMVPMPLRRVAAILGVVVTVIAIGYSLWSVTVLLRNGVMPPMTMVAILVAGLSLFMQVSAVRGLMPVRTGMAVGTSRWSPVQGHSTAANSVGVPAADAAGSSFDRRVHQRFAHQTLRKAVFQDPATVVGVLQGAGGTKYLRDLWAATCHGAGTNPDSVPPTAMESEMTQVGPYSAAIITLPAAQERGEATHVGIVLRSYIRQDGAVIERSPLVLYYTLELDPPVTSDAVLCEWQAGDHVKFADRVRPDFSAFREGMWAKVQLRQQAEDHVANG